MQFIIKVLYIILAIMILLLMITIHEFGHYIAGKILGFKIEEFSIGFGPKIFTKKKKNGEAFSIRWLPLGGYCAFAGEGDDEKILAPEKMKESVRSSDETATETGAKAKDGEAAKGAEVRAEDNATERTEKKFNDQPPWKRIIVLMAGGVFNLLSAIVFSFIFIAFGAVGGASVQSVYQSVEPETRYTLQAGDKIVSIDGQKIDFYHSIQDEMAGKSDGDVIEVVVLRNGEEMSVNVTLHKYDPNYEFDGSPSESGSELPKDENGNIVYPVGMGISLLQEKASIGDAFKYCVPYTGKLAWLILGTFGDLIVGKVPINQVSGPIGTVNQIANYGMQNWAYLLLLLPLIAANLGIFNLFPIPALDGAKVVFTIIEWVRGKPINRDIENKIHFVGLIVLFSLVIILDVVNIIMSVL